MPTWRAVLAAAVPGIVIFADFTLWMGFSAVFAAAVGLIVALAALGVTRLLYDDADGELAAWAEAEAAAAARSGPAAQDQLPEPMATAASAAEPLVAPGEALPEAVEPSPDAPAVAHR